MKKHFKKALKKLYSFYPKEELIEELKTIISEDEDNIINYKKEDIEFILSIDPNILINKIDSFIELGIISKQEVERTNKNFSLIIE